MRAIITRVMQRYYVGFVIVRNLAARLFHDALSPYASYSLFHRPVKIARALTRAANEWTKSQLDHLVVVRIYFIFYTFIFNFTPFNLNSFEASDYTVPGYTVYPVISCTVFFPQIACLTVFTRKTYPVIPCTRLYRALSVSPEKHGITGFDCSYIIDAIPYM